MTNVVKSIRIRCNGRDVLDVTHEKLDTIADEGSIGICELGFKFIKKFGIDYFSGVVVSILENEKRVYKFNGG